MPGMTSGQKYFPDCGAAENRLRSRTTANGGVAERSNAPVLKTGEPQGSVGSNPTSSAIFHHAAIAPCVTSPLDPAKNCARVRIGADHAGHHRLDQLPQHS